MPPARYEILIKNQHVKQLQTCIYPSFGQMTERAWSNDQKVSREKLAPLQAGVN